MKITYAIKPKDGLAKIGYWIVFALCIPFVLVMGLVMGLAISLFILTLLVFVVLAFPFSEFIPKL